MSTDPDLAATEWHAGLIRVCALVEARPGRGPGPGAIGDYLSAFALLGDLPREPLPE